MIYTVRAFTLICQYTVIFCRSGIYERQWKVKKKKEKIKQYLMALLENHYLPTTNFLLIYMRFLTILFPFQDEHLGRLHFSIILIFMLTISFSLEYGNHTIRRNTFLTFSA